LKGKATFGQYRAGANAKVLAAIAAPISHWFVIFAFIDVRAATVAAMRFAVPTVTLEILPCAFLIWEAIEELKRAESFGLIFNGFAHER